VSQTTASSADGSGDDDGDGGEGGVWWWWIILLIIIAIIVLILLIIILCLLLCLWSVTRSAPHTGRSKGCRGQSATMAPWTLTNTNINIIPGKLHFICQETLSVGSKCHQSVWSPGLCPDPAGGAYSAPQTA